MRKPPKVLVIGLDCGSMDLIWDWRDELPCLNGLMQRGVRGHLCSTVPPDTSPAWNSLFTGKNPGKLNIFGFLNYYTDRDKAEGRLRVANMAFQESPSLWDLVSRAGRQAGVVNVPMNFPPRPINGFMLCGGQLTILRGRQGITYPLTLQEEIDPLVDGYETMPLVDFEIPDREDEYLSEIYRVHAKQTKAVEHLLVSRPWDFFTYVCFHTDGIQHYFWHHMDPQHPRHDPDKAKRYGSVIKDFYKDVDATIGRWLRVLPAETNILIVSDHGSGPLLGHFYANEWLQQHGLLTLRREWGVTRLALKPAQLLEKIVLSRVSPRIVEGAVRLLPKALLAKFTTWIRWQDEANRLLRRIRWDKTGAYAIRGGIFLNTAGVDSPDYEALRRQVVNLMRELPHPDRRGPATSRIFARDEIYSGPYSDHGPDLFWFIDDYAYDIRNTVGVGKLWGQAPVSGTHRRRGLFIASGPDIRSTGDYIQEPQIYDVAPTVLHLLGLPVPDDVDGRVLTEILDLEGDAAQRPVAWAHPALVDTTRDRIRRLKSKGRL